MIEPGTVKEKAADSQKCEMCSSCVQEPTPPLPLIVRQALLYTCLRALGMARLAINEGPLQCLCICLKCIHVV
jgi:hypothetical protein